MTKTSEDRKIGRRTRGPLFRRPTSDVRRFSLWLVLAFLLGWAVPAQATTPRNPLIEVQRNPVFNADTLLSDYREARAILNKVLARLEQARQEKRQAPIDRVEVAVLVAQMALGNVEILMESKQDAEASADLDIAIRKIREAQLLLMPSRTVEGRGMILDAGSIPRTQEAIATLMQRLAAANFNFVVPEVFLRGYTVYPSKVTEMDPTFREVPFDVLQVLVEEAHRQGLDVHPWLWTFRVRSPSAGAGYTNPVLGRLPALAAVPVPSSTPSPSPSPSPPAGPRPPAAVSSGKQAGVEDNFTGNGVQFMSPASPEARRFILLLLKDLVERYPVDGVLLDYIRYDDTSANDIVSLTDFRLDYFEKHGQWPPDPLEPGAPEYAEWQLWRELQVAGMVALASKELHRLRKDLTMSVAVFRSEVYARLTKMQNWRHWADNGWVDIVGPMLYTPDADDLDTWLDWETNYGNRVDFLYPILGANRFRTVADLFPQIDIVQQRHIPGFSLFSLTHVNRLSPTLLGDLVLGPFRNPAYPPHRGFIRGLMRALQDLATWLKDIAREGEPRDDDLLNAGVALQKAAAWLPGEDRPLRDPDAFFQHLRGLQSDAEKRFRARNMAQAAITELGNRFQYTYELFRIYQERLKRGRAYIPPEPPPTNVLPETRSLPVLEVPTGLTPPEIDGHLDDELWQSSPPITSFYWQTGASRAQAGTTVRVYRDGRFLYIAFSCSESNMGRIKALDTVRNSGNLFVSDDAVEVFLQPNPASPVYYHFAVNAANTPFSQKVEPGLFKKWDRPWTTAVYQRPDGWDVEIAIPVSTLETASPAPGDKWQANFCRDRHQEVNPFSCWSATYSSYHTPRRFGTLFFP